MLGKYVFVQRCSFTTAGVEWDWEFNVGDGFVYTTGVVDVHRTSFVFHSRIINVVYSFRLQWYTSSAPADEIHKKNFYVSLEIVAI